MHQLAPHHRGLSKRCKEPEGKLITKVSALDGIGKFLYHRLKMSPSIYQLATVCALAASVHGSPLAGRASTPISSITQDQWAALNRTVNGRLYKATPIAKSCYSFYNGALATPDLAQCKAVQDGYTNEEFIGGSFAGFHSVSRSQCSY
jgi:hypothetical protein